MKVVFFIIVSLITTPIFAQHFEGKIVFHNSYKSKSVETPSEYLSQLFGSIHTYEIKKENYKLSSNGELLQWQIYLRQENKLFTKLAAADKLGVKDLDKDAEKVQNAVVNRKSVEILNHLCDEFIIQCKKSTQKYYLDSSLNINPEIFKTSKFNYQLAFLLKNQIVPLKMEIEDNMGFCESIAVEVKVEKIDENIFVMK